jgi:hypothetical protein
LTNDQFVYWLNGFFELSEAKELSEKQVQIIKDHLKLVFEKVTPDYQSPKYQTFPWDMSDPIIRPYTICGGILDGVALVPGGMPSYC